MLKIGLVSHCSPQQWLRYFPDKLPTWDNLTFEFSGNYEDCDLVFVFDAIPDDLCGVVKSKRAVFLATEPPSIKTYDSEFLSQFECVYTTDQSTKHPNVIFGHTPTLWHIGLWDQTGNLLDSPMNFSDFDKFTPKKTKSVSIISSQKAYTTGHRKRLEFANKIKKYFGDEVELFGRGGNGFGDKIDVIPQYRYHIAIENSSYVDYWTEKLSDSYLSLTYPIYNGCPNIKEYYKDDQIQTINIRDIEQSIITIRNLIDSDTAEKSLDNLREARKIVLKKYNLFNIISNICEEIELSGTISKPAANLFSETFIKKYRNKLRRSYKIFFRHTFR